MIIDAALTPELIEEGNVRELISKITRQCVKKPDSKSQIKSNCM